MPRGSEKGKRGGGKKGPETLPDLRAITLRALMEAGGVEYLVRQANENPAPFLGLLGRVMPREVHAEVTAEVRVRQEVRRDLVDKLIVLLQAQPENAASVLTHAPRAMLTAQAIEGTDDMSRKQGYLRREGANLVSGAVLRAAAMHAVNDSDIRESDSEHDAEHDAEQGSEATSSHVRAYSTG